MRAAAHSEVLQTPVVRVTDPASRFRAQGARTEARRLRRSRAGRAITAAIVLLASGLAHVWVRLQVTELGYGLNTTGEIVARLEREQRELEAELAMLTAPQHLAEEARRRLDMREPEPGQVVVLR